MLYVLVREVRQSNAAVSVFSKLICSHYLIFSHSQYVACAAAIRHYTAAYHDAL
jgi:hypothetical protein